MLASQTFVTQIKVWSADPLTAAARNSVDTKPPPWRNPIDFWSPDSHTAVVADDADFPRETKTLGLSWPSIECHMQHSLSVRGLASNHELLLGLSI